MREIRHATCLTAGCPELTATRSKRLRLRCNKCRIAQVRNQASKRGRPKKVRPEGWAESPYVDDPPEVIERNFQQALAEIKRRPRTTEVSWPSSMAGWTL